MKGLRKLIKDHPASSLFAAGALLTYVSTVWVVGLEWPVVLLFTGLFFMVIAVLIGTSDL